MISNKPVCATSKASDQPAICSLIRTFGSGLNILWVLLATDGTSFGVSKLKRGLQGSSESTLVKISHCWK